MGQAHILTHFSCFAPDILGQKMNCPTVRDGSPAMRDRKLGSRKLCVQMEPRKDDRCCCEEFRCRDNEVHILRSEMAPNLGCGGRGGGWRKM